MPARLTKRQQTCSHPTRHIVTTIDPRYEICQLCGLIRTAPLPAPWIVEWDEAQPKPEAPALFAGLTIAEESAAAEYRTIARRDAELLGPARGLVGVGVCREDVPERERTACRRCQGAGYIRDPKRRACPRCGGDGYTRRYLTFPGAVEHRTDGAGRDLDFTMPRSADPVERPA